MKFNELKLGKSVEITVVRDEYKLRLVSKIEDIAEDHFSVTLIEGNGKRFIFKETDEIQIVYKEEDRLWRWNKLKGIITILDGTPVHSFYGASEGESYNRRNAYRIFLGEEQTFSYATAEFESLLQEHTEKTEDNGEAYMKKGCSCIIKDLSERGAGIMTAEKLEKSDVVSFDLETMVGRIHCVGRVVRVSKSNKVPYSYLYGIQFTEVSKVITKYVFAVQRLNLKKNRK